MRLKLNPKALAAGLAVGLLASVPAFAEANPGEAITFIGQLMAKFFALIGLALHGFIVLGIPLLVLKKTKDKAEQNHQDAGYTPIIYAIIALILAMAFEVYVATPFLQDKGWDIQSLIAQFSGSTTSTGG
jgi:hypothetical protein